MKKKLLFLFILIFNTCVFAQNSNFFFYVVDNTCLNNIDIEIPENAKLFEYFNEGMNQNFIYVVTDEYIISKKEIESIEVTKNEYGNIITFILTEEGKNRFAEATRNNIGNKIICVYEDNIVFTATIHDEITGGRVSILSSDKKLIKIMKNPQFLEN